MSKYLALIGLFLTLPPIPSVNSEAVFADTAVTAVIAAAAPEAARAGYLSKTERRVTITAYSSTPEETDNEPFITASGEHVRDGIIAANFLPFGTAVKIPDLFGDRVFVVKDRMNRRYPDRVDIWMSSKAEAKNFGITTARIVVLR